jgi:hypothetical protein
MSVGVERERARGHRWEGRDCGRDGHFGDGILDITTGGVRANAKNGIGIGYWCDGMGVKCW